MDDDGVSCIPNELAYHYFRYAVQDDPFTLESLLYVCKTFYCLIVSKRDWMESFRLWKAKGKHLAVECWSTIKGTDREGIALSPHGIDMIQTDGHIASIFLLPTSSLNKRGLLDYLMSVNRRKHRKHVVSVGNKLTCHVEASLDDYDRSNAYPLVTLGSNTYSVHTLLLESVHVETPKEGDPFQRYYSRQWINVRRCLFYVPCKNLGVEDVVEKKRKRSLDDVTEIKGFKKQRL